MESAADRVSSVIEGVVSRFRAMVRSVGARRGLVDSDLDEVMQEVRIRLWRASEAGKPLAELGSSYLYQTATSAALDLLRRRRAHAAERTEDVTVRPELASPAPTPHEQAEASELSAAIASALATLPQDRRIAVGYHLSGWDREDIGRALGWSEARTRNLVYRGLEDLRNRLRETGIAARRPR
jgi:RNA polymerase sigma factor (sigma-70 family)